MVLFLVIGAVVVLLVLFAVLQYNNLMRLNNQAQADWNLIDPLLQQRLDSIPNLIAMAKRVMKQEKDLFVELAKARESAASAKTVKDKAETNGVLGGLLSGFYARAENYPEMKSNETMRVAMEQLAGVEDKIKYGRQRYGYSVQDYINSTTMFPGNVFAGIFGFASDKWPYFKADEAARKGVDAGKLLEE